MLYWCGERAQHGASAVNPKALAVIAGWLAADDRDALAAAAFERMHAVLAPVVACCRCRVPAAAAAALLRLLQLAFRLLASAVRLVLAPRGGQHPAVLSTNAQTEICQVNTQCKHMCLYDVLVCICNLLAPRGGCANPLASKMKNRYKATT